MSLTTARSLLEKGNAAGALSQCNKLLLRRNPPPLVHAIAGVSLLALKRFAEAATQLDKAIRAAPDDAVLRSNLGVALRELGRLNQAQTHLRRATEPAPGLASAWFNLGVVHQDLIAWDEARRHYEHCLALDRHHAGACNGISVVCRAMGECDMAINAARYGIERHPADPELHMSLAQALLYGGRLAEGWREYEWRRKVPRRAGSARHQNAPPWRGEPIAGKTVLLHAEQGLGDTLHFCRYAKQLVQTGATLVLEVPQPLVRLLRSLSPDITVIAQDIEQVPFDLHCPLMSLPGLLGIDHVSDISFESQYLFPPEEDVLAYRQRLAAYPGMRIGLCWAGGRKQHAADQRADRRRSLRLADVAGLASVTGAQLFSLQKGEASEEIRDLQNDFPIIDWSGSFNDFADTAAFMAELDLVITVDTAIAHAAGTLGKPVWLLNRFDSDWRWLPEREDTPWYPSMRLFRQKTSHDWNDVLAAVKAALADRVANSSTM